MNYILDNYSLKSIAASIYHIWRTSVRMDLDFFYFQFSENCSYLTTSESLPVAE